MTSQLRVLIVEDDDNARAALATLLRDEGYVVDTAGDGRSALEHVECLPLDLIITDISMPGMNGLDLLRRLPDDIPVIAVTAFEDVGDEALALGAWAWLPKPIQLDKLLGITDLIEPRAWARDLPPAPRVQAAGS